MDSWTSKILHVIHSVLCDRRAFYDPAIDYEGLMVGCNGPRWLRMLDKDEYLEELIMQAKGRAPSNPNGPADGITGPQIGAAQVVSEL